MSHAARAQTLSFCVSKSEQNSRLDAYLRDGTQLSRSHIQELIRGGQLILERGSERRVLRQPSCKLAAGDRLSLAVAPRPPAPLEPRPMALSILFEDAHLLVLNKPVGLVVHPAPGHKHNTLVHGLLAHCGAELSSRGGATRPGLVHRLDKDTSGLLVVAKQDAAHQGLAEQFAAHGRDGRLERSYDALVWGVPRPPHGTLNQPLGRHPRARQKQAVRALSAGGRAATTLYRTRAHWEGHISQLRCRLMSGRTHQIRVHLAHAGHPLLGDALYGARQQTKARTLPSGAADAVMALNRQALHASELAFCHPHSGERMRFHAPPPQDMQALIRILGAHLTRTPLPDYDKDGRRQESDMT